MSFYEVGLGGVSGWRRRRRRRTLAVGHRLGQEGFTLREGEPGPVLAEEGDAVVAVVGGDGHDVALGRAEEAFVQLFAEAAGDQLDVPKVDQVAGCWVWVGVGGFGWVILGERMVGRAPSLECMCVRLCPCTCASSPDPHSCILHHARTRRGPAASPASARPQCSCARATAPGSPQRPRNARSGT